MSVETERGRDRLARTGWAASDEDAPEKKLARSPFTLRENVRGTSRWRQPLPAELLAVVGEAERAAYDRVIARLDEVEQEIAATNERLAAGQVKFEQASRDAVRAGERPPAEPAATAKLEQELERLRGEHEQIELVLPAIASAMSETLDAETLQKVIDQAGARRRELLGEAEGLLGRVAELVDQAGDEKGLELWTGTFLERHWQQPSPGRRHQLTGARRERLDQLTRQLRDGVAFAGAAGGRVDEAETVPARG